MKIGVQFWLAAGAISLALLFGYLYISGVKKAAYNEGKADTQKELVDAIAQGNLKDTEFFNKLNLALAKGLKEVNTSIKNIKVENKTIHNEVVREIQNNPMYDNCKSTDAVTGLLNRSRGYGNPE